MTEVNTTLNILETVFVVAFIVVCSLCILCLLGIIVKCFMVCYEQFQIKMASTSPKIYPVYNI